MVTEGEGLRGLQDGIAERVAPEDLGTTRHGAEHLARYLFAANWAPERKVADLCSGAGYGTAILASAGAREAHGFEIDASAVAASAERFGRSDVFFTQADVTQPLDLKEFDLRVCFEGIEHVPDPD